MNGRKPGLLVNFGQFLCSLIRIRNPNTDQDTGHPNQCGGSGSTATLVFGVKKLYFMHKFMCARPQKAAGALDPPLSTLSVTAAETVHHLAVSKSRDVPKSARVSADTEAHDDKGGNPWPYMTDFYKFLTRKAVFQLRDVLIRFRGLDPYHLITDIGPAHLLSGFQDANDFK
jgi:hypothetical protein